MFVFVQKLIIHSIQTLHMSLLCRSLLLV